MSTKARLMADLRELQRWATGLGHFIEMEDPADNDGLPTVVLDIAGPPDTLYAGGTFRLRCQLPRNYPLSSPSVRFLTRVWHPNIERMGSICCDVLGKRWSCATTLHQVFAVYIPALLGAPEPDDPFNSEAAAEMVGRPEVYRDNVLQCVRKYAMPHEAEPMAAKEEGGAPVVP